MQEAIYNVLFLCTGNSARSIMAEAAINHPLIGGGRFRGFSAGSHPTGKVNPLALETLQRHQISTTGLRSKSWDEFEAKEVPQMDFIFTVCGAAAGETCPVWPGHPMQAHWGVEDPAAASGDEETRRRAFNEAFLILKRRIELFAALPLHKLEGLALRTEIDDIGHDVSTGQ